MKTKFFDWRRWGPVLGIGSFYCGVASAQALPWEAPLTALETSLTGTVAKSIGVIALAISGGMLAFGGELNEFTKRVMMVVLALSVMLLASGFITALGLP